MSERVKTLALIFKPLGRIVCSRNFIAETGKPVVHCPAQRAGLSHRHFLLHDALYYFFIIIIFFFYNAFKRTWGLIRMRTLALACACARVLYTLLSICTHTYTPVIFERLWSITNFSSDWSGFVLYRYFLVFSFIVSVFGHALVHRQNHNIHDDSTGQ